MSPSKYRTEHMGKMSMKKRKVSDIQSVIMTVLSLMTVITSISMGLLLYNRYEMAMRQNEVRNTQNLNGKHSQFHGAVSEKYETDFRYCHI